MFFGTVHISLYSAETLDTGFFVVCETEISLHMLELINLIRPAVYDIINANALIIIYRNV